MTDSQAIVCVAMEEEAAPFLAAASANGTTKQIAGASFTPLEIDGKHVLLIQSGIGLVNAATALTIALANAPELASLLVVSAGTAGGLGVGVKVGDIVIGTETTFSTADSTAMGFAYGQLPGMPARYPSTPQLVAAVTKGISADTVQGTESRVKTGLIVSSDAFVTANNIDTVRERFPDAIAAEMETAALAQICYRFGVPFIAVRGISDMCGPAAENEFDSNLTGAAEASMQATRAILAGI